MSSRDFSRPCPETGHYDIFLSFRGGDTRYDFTHNLYRLLQENNFYTFMDASLVGQDINYLFEVIEISRMAVVIYSESYASSDWCLRELDLIMQRRKENKMLIIPIFYKVDVHDLKHLTGNTGMYFDEHLSNYDNSIVEKWMDAVKDFGNVSGLSYQNSHARFEYDFMVEAIANIEIMLQESEEILESCIFEPRYEIVETPTNLMSVLIDRCCEKICIKLSSRSLKIVWADDFYDSRYWVWIPSSELMSSFEEVALLNDVTWLDISGKMDTELLSPATRYGVYFLYKLADDAHGFKYLPVEVSVEVTSAASHTVVGKSVNLDMEGRRRTDGWSEIEMGVFYVEEGEKAEVAMSVLEVKTDHQKGGMVIEGIEIRPYGE